MIRSVPRLDLENKQVLASIPGTPPDLLNPPVGCPFCTRCEYCMEICKEQMPEVTEFGDGHEAELLAASPISTKGGDAGRSLTFLSSSMSKGILNMTNEKEVLFSVSHLKEIFSRIGKKLP